MQALVQGTICQSCAMPIYRNEHFGTEYHGMKSVEYCKYCYQEGSFTDQDINVKEMVDKCVGFMMSTGVLPEPHIREILSEVIPRLKRWRDDNSAPQVQSMAVVKEFV